MVYVIEPAEHWRAGDRAYCTRGLRRDGRWVVETGRLYQVIATRQFSNIAHDKLELAGVDAGEPCGIWSSRFVCIRGNELPCTQIKNRTRDSWHQAYVEMANQRRAASNLEPVHLAFPAIPAESQPTPDAQPS